MYRRTRNVQPISGSCPACLGDLIVSQALGGWAFVCSGCGLLINREPESRSASVAAS